MAREREVLDDELVEEDGGNYFVDQQSPLEFVPTGAVLLDCVLGGGWPLTRIANLVGDWGSGKTLLAIEASANFHRKWPKGGIYYREAESAFDEKYAAALGMPVEAIDFVSPEQFVTVEDMYEDLCRCVAELKKSNQPGLYIVDSLDALSDKAEQKAGFDEGTYGTAKAKMLGKLLRMCKGK